MNLFSFRSSFSTVLSAALALGFIRSSASEENDSLHDPFSPSSVIETITSEELMQHIKFLAGDALEGRDTGSPGNNLAAEYIANEFKAAGLRPIGDNGTFFQAFEVDLDPTPGPNCKLLTKVRGAEFLYEVNKDFLPFDSPEMEAVSGQVVFAGYGITSSEHDYDDYGGIDVTNKIVLMFRKTPRDGRADVLFKGNPFSVHATFTNKVANAIRHGASGILIVDAGNQRETIERMAWGGARPLGLQAGNPIPFMFVSYQLAEEWFRIHDRDLQQVVDQIDRDHKPNSFELTELFAEVSVDIERRKLMTRNVVGLLEGGDAELRHEHLIIGGHFDHVGYGRNPRQSEFIHNGADDNASGTAAVLEVAEAFSKTDERPKRSILFMAFNAEERGLLGSRHYAAHPIMPVTNVVTMLNLDMVGRGANGLDVGGVGTSGGFKAMVDGISTNFAIRLGTRNGGRGPSDHASFYRMNIPVLFFYTGQHEDYHKPSDEWEKINQPEIEEITRIVWVLSNLIANSDERPEFARADGNAARSGRPRVLLGVQIVFDSDAQGVRVVEVTAGSPAEKAGIESGDILRTFGSNKIETAGDLTRTIARQRRGSSGTVQVQRAGKTLTMEVTF